MVIKKKSKEKIKRETDSLNLSQFFIQDEIYNFFGGVDIDKIINKKTYAVWAFTNENLNELKELTSFKNKDIFSVLGSADQAIYFLSQGAKSVINCDTRNLACLFGEFKKSALENLSFEEFQKIFLDKTKENSNLYFEKIRIGLSSVAKRLFDYIFEGLPRNIFLTLSKSKFFYGESWYFSQKNNWLPYFDKKLFNKAKRSVGNFSIFNTSLEQGIKDFTARFDLVYTSNIFDSKNYCPDVEQALIRIDRSLKKRGEILITTQESPKIIIPFLEQLRYNSIIKEPKKKFLTLFSKNYAYYYIVAKKD